jgi:hypothetical protein
MARRNEDDEDLETLFAWRIAGRRRDAWRDVLLLFGFIITFLLGAGVVGAIQVYLVCKPRYPQATVSECLSFSFSTAPDPPAKRGKR